MCVKLIPKRIRFEKLFNKDPPISGIIEPTFHAYKIKFEIDPSSETDPLEVRHFNYFLCTPKVGITGDKNVLKKVYINLKIEPVKKNVPQIRIHHITPTDKMKRVGHITGETKADSSMGAKVGADAEVDLLNLNLGAKAYLQKGKSSNVTITWEYPKKVVVAQSNGVGNQATWLFNLGEAEGWKGHYDLNIYFMIPNTFEPKEGTGDYHVHWDIKINDRELLDESGQRQPLPIYFFGI
jgi:hypothetical protein